MRSYITLVAASLAMALSGTAFGMGNDSSSAPAAKPAADPTFSRAKAMIEAKDYRGALPLLQQVVAKEPKNADAYNLMGFATRKSGDPNGSLQYYQQALSIDGRHIGAYEYLGEAYLMLGRLPEAEQQLARLDSLCTFGCAEYRQLKAAVADYKAGKRPATN